tara:strand:- start:792 stop:1031 length:240 start_codon:yes stop_codon:yes gene_type:complete
MKVDQELIKKIATLSRIELKESEIQQFIPEFQEIFDLFSKIDSLKIKQTEEEKTQNILREDKVKETNLSKEYYKGPKIK